MTEEIERHVVRKFEICQRLGKGVRVVIIIDLLLLLLMMMIFIYLLIRHMVLYGKVLKNEHVK